MTKFSASFFPWAGSCCFFNQQPPPDVPHELALRLITFPVVTKAASLTALKILEGQRTADKMQSSEECIPDSSAYNVGARLQAVDANKVFGGQTMCRAVQARSFP